VSIFSTRHGQPRWRCHGCGAGGTPADLVLAVTGRDPGAHIRALGLVRTPAPPTPARDLEPFIAECAERLWRREGTRVRRWAMGERGLSEEALRLNAIGADHGRPSRYRPPGVPAAGPALVLPTHQHAPQPSLQLRLLRPLLTGARYLSPRGGASGPRLATYRSRDDAGTTVVTEGSIDALSAVTLGFRAIALLGVGAVDAKLADHLVRQPDRLVLALDADGPGQTAQTRLLQLLHERGRSATALTLPAGVADVNAWLTSVTTPAIIGRVIVGSRHPSLER
jgi:hypothetical protein